MIKYFCDYCNTEVKDGELTCIGQPTTHRYMTYAYVEMTWAVNVCKACVQTIKHILRVK